MRVNESITPPQAGSTIAGPGIEGGAPLPSAAIPYDPPNYREGGPASAGPANLLCGGFLELDPGPPSKKASGSGEWNGGAITPIAGPLGEDASLRAELEGCYHRPEGSEEQTGLPVGREGQDFGAPGSSSVPPEEIGKTHGGGPPPGISVVQPTRDNQPGTRLFAFRGYLPPGSRG
jgi:hypothetical protein